MQLIAPDLVAGSSFNFEMSKEAAKFKMYEAYFIEENPCPSN